MAEQRPVLRRTSSAHATPTVATAAGGITYDRDHLRSQSSHSHSTPASPTLRPRSMSPAPGASSTTTPPTASSIRSKSSGPSRKPVPAYEESPIAGTLNFHRRPSTTVDPVSTRPLTAPLVLSQPGLPTSSSSRGPSVQPSSQSHQRRSSHTRQPSISLTSPSQSAFSGLKPSLLPPEPVPTRTKAPIESFASVEMLQSQREHLERRRGSEVFSKDGSYQGRGMVMHQSEVPFTRGTNDPNDRVRSATSSQRMTEGATSLPTIGIGSSSIANQLRDHDRVQLNRPHVSPHDLTTEPQYPSDVQGLGAASGFTFPRLSPSVSPTKTIPPYSLDDDDDDSDDGTLHDTQRWSTASEKLGKEWRMEKLGGPSAAAYGGHRPSIVSLPVYPAPSGSLAQSFRWQARKHGFYLSWITVVVSQIAVAFYFYRRITNLQQVEERHPGVFVTGWMFMGFELFISVVLGINALVKTFTYRSDLTEPKKRLRGDKNLPSIDVFIVSSGQPEQTTFDSAVAAASMDYPAHRFRVMVLDPSSSMTLERDINKHAKTQGCPHLSYHRRTLNANAPGGDMFQTKANSINFGMKEATTFGIKGPGDFIAVIEADMIPDRNFLRATLPEIVADDRIALVRSMHGYVNLPLRLGQAAATLMNTSERSSSGFLLRRSAIVEIGGFPTDSWIQDGHCDALLAGSGFKSVKLNEVVQWGMAKPTYGAQVNQFMMDSIGPLRTAGRLNFFLWGAKIRLMSPWERLCGIARALHPLAGLLTLLLTAAYPFMFTYGGIIVLTPNLDSLIELLQACLFMVVACAFHDLVWGVTTGLPTPRRDLQVWVFSAPYIAVAIVRFMLPYWLGGYVRGSDVDLNVTVTPARAPLYKRLLWLVIDPHAPVILAYLASVGVVIWRAVRDYEHGTVDRHQTALTLLLTVFWPSMVWLDFLYASLVPCFCLVFPSRLLTESRDKFLIRDSYSSVARPKHACKSSQPFKVYHWPEVVTSVVVIVWSAVCVGLSQMTDIFA